MDSPSRKRSRSRSPGPVRRGQNFRNPHQRAQQFNGGSTAYNQNSGFDTRRPNSGFDAKRQTQLNALQEERDARRYISQEDDFVLKQARKKAQIRIEEQRAKPNDWLTILLTVREPDASLLESSGQPASLGYVFDPALLIEAMDYAQLEAVETEAKHHLTLEKKSLYRNFWTWIMSMCGKQRVKLRPAQHSARINEGVAEQIEGMLGTKTLEKLQALEKQVEGKLASDEDIDVDYWEHLLDQIKVYKARAQLRDMYRQTMLGKREQLESVLDESEVVKGKDVSKLEDEEIMRLKIKFDEQRIAQIDFAAGRVPLGQSKPGPTKSSNGTQPPREAKSEVDGGSQLANSLYAREAARGVDVDEEIFTTEETLTGKSTHTGWTSTSTQTHIARKPLYFNRVQMGYEWNKYNQTHYDQDNPPPKAVQGYKFNIFYPDLIDVTRAPTFKIERENGRKKGQSFAQPGENDTCIIRFISGAPYEDLAFRIVDKEWDYSGKRDRGFKSSFQDGILQLHFSFKKVYYRK